jgi:ABC-type glycerol-3-phosphate transport system substrate-binding protein
MCKKVLRVPAMALVLTLAVSAGVFAGGAGQKSSSQDITVLTTPNMNPSGGIAEGYYWADILREDLGIVLEAITPSAESVQAALAARDLPDIFWTNVPEYINNAVQAGLLYNLDDYKARLPNVFANGGAMLQYVRDNVSPGRLDFIRGGNSNTPNTRGGNNLGPYLRWDYYKELGMPVITEWEDYLPVLKAMVDRHCVTKARERRK